MLCLCAHLHHRLKRKSIFRSGVETSIDLGLGCFVQETDMSIPIKAIRRFLSPEAEPHAWSVLTWNSTEETRTMAVVCV